VTNQLLDDFVAACRPVRCKVVSSWTPRGGITTNVTCSYEEENAPQINADERGSDKKQK
jgi:7-cyano-7-deazaguanine reductase